MGEIGAAVAAAGPGPAAASGDAAGGSERFAPYVKCAADGTASLSLIVENIHCAACIRRIETRLTSMQGVIAALSAELSQQHCIKVAICPLAVA